LNRFIRADKLFFLVFFVLFFAGVCFAESGNPFGVKLNGDELTFQQRLQSIKDLGAKFIRPADITVEGWPNNDKDAEDFGRFGYKLILTVESNVKVGDATSSLVKIDDYKKAIREIVKKHKPELLVIENEEDNSAYHKETTAGYFQELTAACSVAHEEGFKCANGGLSSNMLALLVWDNYYNLGDYTRADSFLRRAFAPWQMQELKTIKGRIRIQPVIERGKEFIGGYKNSGIDYVNFHWYIPDAEAFQEAVGFLENETGLTAVTNEIGMIDSNLSVFKQLLSASLDLELPYVVWLSVEGTDTQTFQDKGGFLLALGRILKSFIQENFTSSN